MARASRLDKLFIEGRVGGFVGEIPTTATHGHESFHELRGDLRDDGVTRAAQCAHPVGYPMSQRLNAGFNAPGFSV